MSVHVVTLGVDLKVDFPKAGERYQLLLFATSATSHPNAQQTLLHDVEPNSSPLTAVCRVTGQHGLMHVWLFTTSRHAQLGIEQTLLLAWGCVELDDIQSDGVRLELTDVASKEEAVVHLSLQSPVTPPFDSSRMVASVQGVRGVIRLLYQRVHDRIISVYDQLKRAGLTPPSDQPDRSHYYYVATHMGLLPITTFAYLSTLADGTLDLLRVLHAQAVREIDSVERCSSTCVYTSRRRMGEQLVAMCTMLPRALNYTEDMRRTSHGDVSVDQWVQLGTFPRMSAAGFDCEDGAGLVMSVLRLLRTCRIPHGAAADSHLLDMQAFANRFTPCMTLGNMRVGPNEYTSHAYTVLVDRDWFTAALSGAVAPAAGDYLPAMSLESTASISGVWDDDAHTDAGAMSESFASLKHSISRTFRSQPDLLQTLRQFTPLSALNHAKARGASHRGSYQDQYVLMAPDHMGTHVVHCVVSDESHRTVGALAERVLAYDPSVRLHQVINQSRTEFEAEYMCLWKQEPQNRLPTAAAGAHLIAPFKPVVCDAVFDIPLNVFTQQRVLIHQLLTAGSSDLQLIALDPGQPLTACGMGFARAYVSKRTR